MDFKCNYCVADLETGGLFSNKNPIVEVAVVVLNQELNIIDKYCSIVNAISGDYGKNYIIEDQALKANGLTKEDIVQGEKPEIVFKEISDLFKKYTIGRNKPILVGHNWNSFDSKFLEAFFNFYKQDLYSFVEKYCYDTLWMARSCWIKDVSNYKLGSCCEKAGIELTDAHEALADTIATSELFKYFMDNMRNEKRESNSKKFRHTFQF